MNYRKKLIEVALPLEAINVASAREKSIRHGHPSTLHLWWARRPLAACRAVLFASLVDDPGSDPMFGGDEGIEASKRAELFNLIEELVQWDNSNNPRVINKARAEIARSIASRKIETGELKKDQAIPLPSPSGRGAGGEGEGESSVADRKRAAVKGKAASALPRPGSGPVVRAYTPHEIKHMLASPEAVNHFLATYGPPVLDPFCGGGSIPLEAQRLGLRAYGSDLNPVAVLITKALIEIPPKFAGMPPVNPEWQKKSREGKAATVWQGAQGLAEDVRFYGTWMRHEAEKRVGHLYQKAKITSDLMKGRPDLKKYGGQEVTVVAWLWSRTIASPDPSCKGTHVPLVKSLCLCNRKGHPVWLSPVIDRANNSYRFDIRFGNDERAVKGTVNRKGGKCLLSGAPIPFDYIRAEGKAGRLGTRLIAMIADAEGERLFLPALPDHERVACEVVPSWVPDNTMAYNPFSLRPPLYGLDAFSQLFTNRQLSVLSLLCELIDEVRKALAERQRLPGYSDAVATYLAFALNKCADYSNTIATWMPRGTVGHAFSKQSIPMTWDYPEANLLADFHCAWHEAFDWVAKVIDTWTLASVPGNVGQADATIASTSLEKIVISTDPPYYNNIDYADLSDFFYVWLRRCLKDVYPDLFATVATPKSEELVATPYRFDGDKDRCREFFEAGLESAFHNMRKIGAEDYPLTVFYAFKQAETEEESEDDSPEHTLAIASTGWETMLEGLIRSSFVIDGTWPIRTERSARTMSIGMNALASSVVLVCRPRPDNASLATRKEFITALRRELPEALRNLQRGSIAPVDLAQAAIGPGMAVFTRYAKVLESDGAAMTVRAALGLINQALDEVLAEQEGEFDGDTRWALAWFEQFGVEEGPFGVAETLSRAKNTAVNGLVEAGIAKARGGKVQLLKRAELPEDWKPAEGKRLAIWEVTQHLMRTLDQKGESGAAALLHKLGGLGEAARDLAYRLYTVCERKKWAEEALAYNGLVIAWPELTKLAAAQRTRTVETQHEMFPERTGG